MNGPQFFSPDFQALTLPGEGQPPFAPMKMAYRTDEDRQIFESCAPNLFRCQRMSAAFFASSPLNLLVFEFAAGFLLPLHSHSVDCLYYVVKGSIEMGTRQVGPGGGFLVPAKQPYAYRVGPEGVTVIEFRDRPADDLTVHERDLARWKKRFQRSICVEES